MKKKHNLTETQLEEIKELAKTLPLKEIASHFNISTSNFRVTRKEQPEIDAIYNAVPKDRLRTKYTPTELLETEKMLATLSMTEVIKHLGISMATLTKARNLHPELEEALTRGMENRPSNFNGLMLAKQKELKQQQEIIEKAKKAQEGGKEATSPKVSRVVIPIENKDSLFTRAPEDISIEYAIVRFRRLQEEAKKQRNLKN
jgi:uncharacterized protein YyaL (SSP411 family)